ncbi:phosphate signaling complex protein PhoU [Kiritimatiellota bacterium B12222]|nr:phosphate signaling complex protein PhoU [Kiritimatiellota bacterium B12222]
MPILHLHREIIHLNKLILQLGGHVEENLRLGVQAIQQRDGSHSSHIMNEDVVVDSLEVRVEEECLKILALHQPVASDLRYIVAILKINVDLERIGDLASSLVRNSSDLIKNTTLAIPTQIAEMADLSREMLHQSLDALVARDVISCQKILMQDKQVDRLYMEIKTWFKAEMSKSPTATGAYLDIYLTAKNLERIADHSCNIAEDVIYLVTGEIVRHHDVDKLD